MKEARTPFDRGRALRGMNAAIEAFEAQGLTLLEALKAAEWMRAGCLCLLEQAAACAQDESPEALEAVRAFSSLKPEQKSA